MTKLPILSPKRIITALKAVGFEEAPKRGKGSHEALVKRTAVGTRLVIIPHRKSLPKGTLRAILEQSGLSRDEFINLLES